MQIIELIRRVRMEIGDNPKPFRSLAQGDNVTSWVDLIQPNVNQIGFSVMLDNGVDQRVLSIPAEYTVDADNGQVMFTQPIPRGWRAIVTGTTYGMFSDNQLLPPLRDALTWHCHGRNIQERYADRHNFITYRQTPINLNNLPPEEELPLVILSTLNTYWMLADDMALDVNVQTAESTAIDRTARYSQIMHHIEMLQARYDDLCSTFNIGPNRMQVHNLRRTSRVTGRLVPLFVPREYDDRSYPTRMLPPVDKSYQDNSGIPSQIFYGSSM